MLSRTPYVIKYMCCYALPRICHACRNFLCSDLEPHLELSTFALWWSGESTVYNRSDRSFSEAIFQIVGQYVTTKGVGTPLLTELLWNVQCTCMRGWCSLSLSLFSWILQKIVFLVGVGDAIRNTQWYAMHILFCIVEGLTRMLQVSLLRLWILCLGSGLWSPILSCWPCTLVIVRKCTL